MGYVPLTHLKEAYVRIKEDAASSGGGISVLVFVTADADSLCALKILLKLFKSDCIAYLVVPVAGLDELNAATMRHVQENTEIKSLVMLNCGGILDLESFFPLSEKMSVYVIDSHRPVIVFDDGEADEMKPVQEAFQALEYQGSDSDEPDDDENEPEDPPSDAEETLDAVRPPSLFQTYISRTPLHRKTQSPTRPGDLTPRSRRRKNAAQKRKRRRDYQMLVTEYYSEGTYYGTSASSIMYTLATQMGKVNGEMLSIIGVSDQYVHERIDASKYRTEASLLKDETTRFDLSGRNAPQNAFDDPDNPDDPLFRDDDDDDYRDPDNPEDGHRPNRLLGAQRPGAPILRGAAVGVHGVRNAHDRNIKCVDEFRLMLLRHWSLYESLYHSSYVATSENGDLTKKLPALGPAFNLPDLMFPSFLRHYGYKFTIGAADAVHGVTALLDCGADWMRRQAGGEDVEAGEGRRGGQGLLWGRRGTAAVRVVVSEFDRFDAGRGEEKDGGESGSEDEEEAEEDEERGRGGESCEKEEEGKGERVDEDFYLAYDALENVDLLYHGIHLSMQFQRALVRAGDGGGGGVGGLVGENEFLIFGRSVPPLCRLASFLMDAYREHRKKVMPLVIAAYNDETDGYLVLGNRIPRGMGMLGKSKAVRLSNDIAFQLAAEKTGVPRDDLLPFIESLQASLSA
ncbi:CDC45-like protein-domain-containing protein [Chytridium lagenaria]|nr:CDC45-like protein-domain-containing protein [Chytridium lagenaria]